MAFDIKQLAQIRQLDFEHVAVWPKEVKWMLALAIILLAGIVGWWWLINPILPQLASANAQESTLKHQYRAKYYVAVNADAYKTQLEQMHKEFAFMLKALPSSHETAGLLDDITYVGTTSGLTFRLLQWQPKIIKEFYTQLPIQIEVTGKYHDFGQFVTDIATLPRIVTLHDFILNNESDGLRLHMQARTYHTLGNKEHVTL